MILLLPTPRIGWALAITVFVSALLQRTGVVLGYWQQQYNPNVPFALLLAGAYILSLRLCIKIASDHRSSPAMQFAWLLFAGSSAMSIVRHTMQAFVASLAIPGFDRQASYLPIQLPMAISLVLLFAGLLAMWTGLSSLRLGFHARRSDLVLVTLMLLMLPPVLVGNAERLPVFVTGWVRILPLAGAILLPACGGIAVLLRRIEIQMGGGDMARVLQLLIWYPGIRLVAMVASVNPFLRGIVPLSVLVYAMYQAAPFLFLIALTYRWQITLKASSAIGARQSVLSELYPIEV